MAVTERQVHQAALDGAKTLNDLRQDLGVASVCGLCGDCARNCLKQAQPAKLSVKNSNMLATACT
jgi:bacterioferritin-associated ferredoxin